MKLGDDSLDLFQPAEVTITEKIFLPPFDVHLEQVDHSTALGQLLEHGVHRMHCHFKTARLINSAKIRGVGFLKFHHSIVGAYRGLQELSGNLVIGEVRPYDFGTCRLPIEAFSYDEEQADRDKDEEGREGQESADGSELDDRPFSHFPARL